MSRQYAARDWRRIGVWFAVAAAVALAGGWLAATERRDPWLVGIIGALFVLRAGHAFWRAWRVDRTPRAPAVPREPEGASPAEVPRGGLVLLFAAWVVLSAWVAYDLLRLERGEAEWAYVFAPAAWLYRLFGFWAGVIVTPVLGVLFALFLARQRGSPGRRSHGPGRCPHRPGPTWGPDPRP